MTHRERALQILQAEHRALVDVLQLLQHLLRDVIAQRMKPDFPLLCAGLYYMDEFASRCHHPKEDRYLFAAIRRRAPKARDVLLALQAEHRRDRTFVRDLHRLLVLYQAGAPGALEHLNASLNDYAAVLSAHMRSEEALLAIFADALPEDEWCAVAEGFQREEEPIFAAAPQQEFAKLRARITNMLPRKLRIPSQGRADAN